MAILYNLGTNIFLSDVSYLTMALTAILQLGVTMDYSIFLLHSYESNKIRFENDKERAMAHAISIHLSLSQEVLLQRLLDSLHCAL